MIHNVTQFTNIMYCEVLFETPEASDTNIFGVFFHHKAQFDAFIQSAHTHPAQVPNNVALLVLTSVGICADAQVTHYLCLRFMFMYKLDGDAAPIGIHLHFFLLDIILPANRS